MFGHRHTGCRGDNCGRGTHVEQSRSRASRAAGIENTFSTCPNRRHSLAHRGSGASNLFNGFPLLRRALRNRAICESGTSPCMMPPIAERISSIDKLSPADRRPRCDANTITLSVYDAWIVRARFGPANAYASGRATQERALFWRIASYGIQSCQDRHDLATEPVHGAKGDPRH